ncbi:MAG: LysM peptidoglycan-binding domain-containing protein [Chitinophagales bacterium]
MKIGQINFFIITLLLFLPLLITAQNRGIQLKKTSIEDYIKEYAPLCQQEMKRTGIPASIKLAQGILESNYGNSKLAQEAKNHFGIKCHSGWTGKGYYMDDDAKDECFRVYKDPHESYMDHSNFLMTRSRYAFLFEVDSKDYQSWAKGLKRAGYATNPQYANLLIRVIEERKLYRFDKMEDEQSTEKTKEELLADLNNKIYVFNGIKTVVSQPGETAELIAEKYQLTLRQLLKYNDFESGDEVRTGSKVYLQPKKRRGQQKYHTVKEGETMASISQTEGIKLRSLYKKNRMDPGEEPMTGERLCLKRKCKDKPRLKTEDQIRREYEERLERKIKEIKDAAKKKKTEELKAEQREKAAELEALQEEEAETKDTLASERKASVEEIAMVIEVDKPDEEREEKSVDADQVATDTRENYQSRPIYHIVEPKQTLYAISRLYTVQIDELLSWNQLSNPILEIDQELIVGFENVPFSGSTGRAAVSSEKIKADLKPNSLYPLYHKVLKGETLYRIAVNNNITVGQLLEWNTGVETNNLSIGDMLIIGFDRKEEQSESENSEGRETDEVIHTLQAGETLYSLSKKYNVTVDELILWNKNININDMRIGDKIIVGKTPESPVEEEVEETKKSIYHTVAKGETLYAISKKYDVSVQQLIEWNKFKSNELSVGQKIIVGYE